MKKLRILLVSTFIVVALAGVSSAEGFYIRLGGGYGLGIGGTYIGQQRTEDDTWVKDVTYNVGQGFPIAGEVGFKLNENFALELGGGYTIGTESEKIGNEPFETYMNYKGSWIPVTVGLKFSSQLGPLKPYFSVGTGVYLGTTIATVHSEGTPIVDREITYSGASIGTNSSLGMEFLLSDVFSIFAEARFDKVAFIASNAELTKYAVDGVDKLSTLNINDKHLGILDIPATIDNGGPIWLGPLSADCLSIRAGICINL